MKAIRGLKVLYSPKIQNISQANPARYLPSLFINILLKTLKITKANKIDAVYIYENIRTAMAYLDEDKDITKDILKKIK